MSGALILMGAVLLSQADAAASDATAVNPKASDATAGDTTAGDPKAGDGAAADATADAAADDERKLQVRRLVRQLDAPQLDEREAAEEKLVQLGPAILELLPGESEGVSAEVAQRVARIRQKLQQAMAESAAEASRLTLQGERSLSEILAAFQEQTGNKVVVRLPGDPDLADFKLNVAFDDCPFWQALDRLSDQAGLDVAPFAADKVVTLGLRSGSEPLRVRRAGYSGPFRFEAVMIQAARDLRNPANQSLRLTLEVAWEPRLAPMTLQQRMADVEAFDDRGKPIPVGAPEAVFEVPVLPDSFTEQFEIPLALPTRDVQRIARLKGTLTALLPGKVGTFRFTDLEKAEKVPQRIAGVTVVLDRVRQDNGGCEVRVRIRFDEAGGALASHRTWIFYNEVSLETPDGKSISQFSSEPTLHAENEVGIAYHFSVDGPLSDYTFVYKTPALILSAPVEYELRDIELP
jgi:hypothetical protein